MAAVLWRRERRPLAYASPLPNLSTPIFQSQTVFLDVQWAGTACRKILEMPCAKETACVRARTARAGGRARWGLGVGGRQDTSVFAAVRRRSLTLLP
ncbi:hypothetical protein E2C01_050063 [Portunus trituberculatus]|uniref:Uncharacterized protein n=1 Tax=Portunus trituberculatus TaxID=210409 RepID=A0A5B7G799_PORTR|nr:hypothetical protein [Portunus trituberculatus]